MRAHLGVAKVVARYVINCAEIVMLIVSIVWWEGDGGIQTKSSYAQLLPLVASLGAVMGLVMAGRDRL